MTTLIREHVREGTMALRAAVRMAENICSLPAVATQDWCDRAAAALLPACQPAIAVTMIGQIDDRGTILRQEATGVAGCYAVEVTTNIGRSSSATSVVPIDATDANLVRVRTMMAQARELYWTPGNLAPGHSRAGTPASFGGASPWESTGLGRRWDAIRATGMLLGAIALGGGRVLAIEIAATGPVTGGLESEAAVLDAALPALAKRTIMAIGTDPTDGGHWLTAREQVILQHLLLGKSVREIADELGRSPHTVHDHVKSLHRKLNASSRGELVARALGHVEPPPLAKLSEHEGTVQVPMPQVQTRIVKGHPASA